MLISCRELDELFSDAGFIQLTCIEFRKLWLPCVSQSLKDALILAPLRKAVTSKGQEI